jgi:hypothetical protein
LFQIPRIDHNNSFKKKRIVPTMVQSQEECITYNFWHGKVGHAGVFSTSSSAIFWEHPHHLSHFK